MPWLLEIWREVGGHLRIEEAVDLVTPKLSSRLPLEGLIVRRLDMAHLRAETVAEGWTASEPRSAGRVDRVTSLGPEEVAALTEWVRSDHRVREVPRSPNAPMRRLSGWPHWGGDALLGLLASDGVPQGLAVFLSGPGDLATGHLEVAERVLDPLGAALANDGRIREMERLREALEADRRALLTRLARHDVADAVVGAESGLREVMVLVEQVAATDAPVLLLGETGTGKEVVAREIHKRSPRARGPVERVNCGAIPAGLVDSELFGHERGSFTGAVNTRKGWFERADGGTLFLDEIGELPGEAQVRLLRVLQDGTFERVGGQGELHADVRVVAATHRNLASMVENGRFREDLWFRLNVFPIEIPPLRNRREDIPALAAHFGWRAGRRLGRGPLAPAPEDLELLVSYDWPGNVRELGAVIERAAILGNGEWLEIRPALGNVRAREGGSGPAVERSSSDGTVDRVAPLDSAMADHIRKALAVCRGRIDGEAGAARLLEIHPNTLRSRMRRLGVDWRRFRES